MQDPLNKNTQARGLECLFLKSFPADDGAIDWQTDSL